MVLETWAIQIESIKQATKLNLELFSCLVKEWPDQRECFESQGGEVIQWIKEGRQVHYLGIKRSEWPDSSRALLSLLFPGVTKSTRTVHDQLSEWLQQIWQGDISAIPFSLMDELHWTQPRACFLLERKVKPQIGEPQTKVDWRKLFQSFFPEGVSFTLTTITPAVSLLLVPTSVLVESPSDQEESIWLEWALSLQDVLLTEANETVRILTTNSVSNPSQLSDAVLALHTLSKVLHQLIPNQQVAATWQYRLEQWVISMDTPTQKQLRSTLPFDSTVKLTQEQLDLLDVLFRQNLNISETARSLYIHRNTLLYRLDKITELTGLDPRIFMDAVLLRLFILFRHFD